MGKSGMNRMVPFHVSDMKPYLSKPQVVPNRANRIIPFHEGLLQKPTRIRLGSVGCRRFIASRVISTFNDAWKNRQVYGFSALNETNMEELKRIIS